MRNSAKFVSATALLFALAGTVHMISTTRLNILANPLMPATHGEGITLMEGSQMLSRTPIFLKNAAAAFSVVIAAEVSRHGWFKCPGPPKILSSARSAIIRGCGTTRKARTFLNRIKTSWINLPMNKMRVRMQSRFYIT